jgi:hypothetical protein
MSATATAKAKAKKIADGGAAFFIPELDTMNMMARGGRAVLRGATYVGLSALAASPKIQAKPMIAKNMGWVALLLGTGAELFMNENHNGAVALSGIAQGLSTYGLVDTTAMILGTNAAKWGLAGLGAADDGGGNDGMDWMALAARADAMVNGGGGSSITDDSNSSMAGLGATLDQMVLTR